MASVHGLELDLQRKFAATVLIDADSILSRSEASLDFGTSE